MFISSFLLADQSCLLSESFGMSLYCIFYVDYCRNFWSIILFFIVVTDFYRYMLIECLKRFEESWTEPTLEILEIITDIGNLLEI